MMEKLSSDEIAHMAKQLPKEDLLSFRSASRYTHDICDPIYWALFVEYRIGLTEASLSKLAHITKVPRIAKKMQRLLVGSGRVYFEFVEPSVARLFYTDFSEQDHDFVASGSASSLLATALGNLKNHGNNSVEVIVYDDSEEVVQRLRKMFA